MSRATKNVNPWVGITYIPDNTRMATPPAHFLQVLHDYDGDLVIVPSRKTPYAYVIARRQRYSGGITSEVLHDTIDQPDTKMCLRYGLVPVCLMYRTGDSWDVDAILNKLKARDIWAHGGADKVADIMEEEEAKVVAAKKKQIRDDLWNRSGDAYRTYKRRTGQSVSLAPNTTRTGRRMKLAPTPSKGMTGLGAQLQANPSLHKSMTIGQRGQ